MNGNAMENFVVIIEKYGKKQGTKQAQAPRL